jgi:hypothetical protein
LIFLKEQNHLKKEKEKNLLESCDTGGVIGAASVGAEIRSTVDVVLVGL